MVTKTLSPLQIVVSFPAMLPVGNGFTVTVLEAIEEVHPLSIATTLYVPPVEAVIEGPVVLGVVYQRKVTPLCVLCAVIATLLPAQI